MNLSLLRKTPFLIFFIVVLVFIAYSFALQGSFKTMDDEVSIVKNDDIKSFANFGKILTSSFFRDKSYHRPFISISFMIEYHFWGLNALYYYLTNIFLHGLNAILVFFLLRRLWGGQTMIAFWSALLFAIHPVQWEAVSNIPGRSNLLLAFFYFSSFLLTLRCLDIPQGIRQGKGLLIYGFSLFCFLLALLSKESAGVLPFLLLVYVFLVRRDLIKNWQKIGAIFAGYFLLGGGFVIFRKMVGIDEVFSWGSIPAMLLGVGTFLRGVLTYFRLFIFPVDLQFDRSRKIFTDFVHPEMWMAILVFVFLFIFIVANRKRIPALVLFFMAWFCIDLVPVSQIFASIGVQPGYISTAEHFLYTPSIPALALIVLGLQWVYERNRQRKWMSAAVFQIALAGLFLFLYLTTIQHNIYSSNEIAMLERTLIIYPDNIRIRNSLATSYARLGLYKEAERHFRKSLEIFPGGAWARIGLGKALCDQGRYWEGIQEYEMVYDPGRFKDVLEENLRLTYGVLGR